MPGEDKIYRGRRDLKKGWGVEVTVNGQPLHNADRQHSMGFEWGYGGAGPSALAVSILSDYYGLTDENFWERDSDNTIQPWQYYYRTFLDDIVKKLSRTEEQWELTSEDIKKWMETKEPYDDTREEA